jgi:hypothetical protein
MRSFFALALFTSLLFTPLARAQHDDPSRVAAARALFQEGVGLARRGEYDAAVDRFRRAQALRPAPPIAFNLAAALVHTGDLVEASEILEHLLRDPLLPRDIRTSATRERDELAPRLSRVTVRLEGEAGGVQVAIDDHELPGAAIGVPVPIDPGAHEVVASRDRAAVARERFEVAEGATRQISLTIPPRPTSPEPPSVDFDADRARASETDVDGEPHDRIVASTDHDGDEAPPPQGNDDGVWIGVGIGIALAVGAGAAVTAVLLTMPPTPSTVTGNAMPGVLTW